MTTTWLLSVDIAWVRWSGWKIMKYCSFTPALWPSSAEEEDWPQCQQVPLEGKTGSKGGGDPVRLSDVYTWELVGFQNQLIRRFMLVADVISGSLWVTQMDQHSWKGSWWDWVLVGQSSGPCKWNGAYLQVWRALDPFLQCEKKDIYIYIYIKI